VTALQQHQQSEQWLTDLKQQQSTLNLSLLSKACELAETIAPQTVTPYATSTLTQGLQIADMLLALDCDSHTIAAAILYPSFYYGHIDKEIISDKLDTIIYKLLAGTQKMEATYNLRGENQDQPQLTNLRKMFLAIVDDVRVVLIKLAEQLTVLMNLKNAPPAQQVLVAQQVMDMYAPLANRLGIGQLKWQLEDYAFRYLDPDNYKAISKALKMRRTEREHFIQDMISRLTKLFTEHPLKNFEIAGRAKHIYSIHKKIERKRTSFEEIYDASALRVLVDQLEDCYTALSLVHASWNHIAKEFDDYVTTPKENGYQSIHTAVTGPNNNNVEIQIRTRQMHEDAELGVAAHWKYKEGNSSQGDYEDKIAWLREVMSWQKEVTGEDDTSISKIFDDRAYVFTPAGDVFDLPSGATPLDFAYHIHSSVGHCCKGAKVNNKMVPLTHTLVTGDRIEIINSKQEQPSRDWLDNNKRYLTTSNAKAKVRQWFKKQNFDRDYITGIEIWSKVYKREGFNKNDYEKVCEHFNFNKPEQLIAAIGSGNIGAATVAQQIKALVQPKDDSDDVITPFKISPAPRKKSSRQNHLIVIEGIDDCLTSIATCCNPIPGDKIIGYITQGSGVTIHQHDCKNIQHSLIVRPHRIIQVNWDDSATQHYRVELIITVHDRQGLIRDITAEIMQQKITLLGLSTQTNRKENIAYLNVSIEINADQSLQKIQHHLQNVEGVINISR
jgi:GTP pyrophosphokinase